MRSQIEIAIAAALSVNVPLYWLFTRRNSDGRPNPLTLGEVGVLALVFGCYLAIPLIVRVFRERRIVQAVPVWLWISIVGATLIVIADYSLGIRYRESIRLDRVAKEWLVLSVFTMPATALIYYSRALIGLIRKWHEGESFNLHVVRK
ncbi:MAG TPA: hypothetical protein VM911_01235 [Pyrinomonadaceae bacterium]|jgi:hypothetical protein|nr:hypothetical protein [Pyrinomonadaceae bacterium]